MFFLISLCFCFVSASLFSENYILPHGEHDCPGEGCPVCPLIQGAANFSRQAKNAVLPEYSAAVRWMALVMLHLVVFRFIPLSAVRLKVKMNL
ncbi:hypothetical protein LQZ21_09430 [Treponema sp. TIM-1]|uniref:hypothetical protein n=1 Tax=Treponema sp. TIM-1 TaxID=2898417 RepID=UPI0039810FBD